MGFGRDVAALPFSHEGVLGGDERVDPLEVALDGLGAVLGERAGVAVPVMAVTTDGRG